MKKQLFLTFAIFFYSVRILSCFSQELDGFAVQNSTKESYSNEVRVDDKFDEYNVQKNKAQNKIASEEPSPFRPKTPTPSRFFAADLSMPDVFTSSNNLAKKTGSFYRAYGEIIFIQGTITDSFGVPVHGAVVEIWQTNASVNLIFI